LIVGGIATSVLAFGIGVGLTAAANGASTDAADLRAALRGRGALCPGVTAVDATDCTTLYGHLQDQSTLSNAAVGLFVVSGLVGAATAAYALWPVKRPARGIDVRAAPTVSKGAGGVWIAGTF
jgi:hypothetical protein